MLRFQKVLHIYGTVVCLHRVAHIVSKKHCSGTVERFADQIDQRDIASPQLSEQGFVLRCRSNDTIVVAELK